MTYKYFIGMTKLLWQISSVLKSIKLLDHQVQTPLKLRNKNLITTYRFLSDGLEVAYRRGSASS